MRKYFININNMEELKREYKKLALELHPDRPTGNHDKFTTMQNEYELIFNILKEQGEAKTGTINNEVASEYMEIINQIINLQGIEIEIVGTWVWVSGLTFPHKDILKSLGFTWRGKKKMWSLGEFTGRKHKEWSMDKIRSEYGSQKIETKSNRSYQIA